MPVTALPHVMRSHLQFGAVLDNAVIRLEMQKSSLKLNNIFVTVLRGADCLEPCWSLDLDYCGVVLAAGSAELTPERRRVVRAGVLGRGRGAPVSPACDGGAAGWSRRPGQRRILRRSGLASLPEQIADADTLRLGIVQCRDGAAKGICLYLFSFGEIH